MKCVKYKGGEIRRITDEAAQELVASKQATYCSKEEWKAVDPDHPARSKAEETRKKRAEEAKAKAAKGKVTV